MDVVYLLGTGSKWEDNEIRYSLRSLEMYGRNYENVYIIGCKPSFLNDTIIHIPMDDVHTNKQRNIHEKLLTASNDTRISKEFVFMNDDYFLLQNYWFEKEYFYHRSLIESFNITRPNKYSKHIFATMKLLQDFEKKNFDSHYPFVLNKYFYRTIAKKIDWNVEIGYLTRTLYLYHLKQKVKWTSKSDCLVHKPNQDFPNQQIVSVSTNGLTDNIKLFLELKYPNKSKYEI